MLKKFPISECLLLAAGVAMVGCGSAATDSETDTSQSSLATPQVHPTTETPGGESAAVAHVTPVSLDLPGMT